MLADGPIPGLAARTLVSSFLTGAFLAPLLPSSPSLSLLSSLPLLPLFSLFSLFSHFSFLLKLSHQHQKKAAFGSCLMVVELSKQLYISELSNIVIRHLRAFKHCYKDI